ncbi:MAG: serine/threonine protein kinase [Myxococcales bacterium]|nr:serine/threonine protein kinase [Myxococcales bacterium]MCB9715672.1 serine/threonine protein kinase [Myxococcales bacterium]
MSDANLQASAAERPSAPWGDEITPLTEVCGGQYVLLHELARGDLSIVYRAKPAGSRDSIAFKVLQPRYVGDEAQVRRFRREAELLRKIEHPNVVRLIDHGTIEDGRDFIALELLVGSTLAEARAKSTRMSPERTCRIARQVARALRTMHKAGVIHRDLEPENILLIGPENAERVKLVDFSQAGDVGAPARRVKVSKDRPQSGVMGDEPSYRAPEQLRKRPPHPSMDVFALGVIMYEMLAGEHPFYQAPPEPGARVGPHTIRSKAFDAPEELLGLVADCIEEDPAERPGSMDEVIERIDKALLWMGVVPHEIATKADEDARTQLWAAADPEKVSDDAKTRAQVAASSGPMWSRVEPRETEAREEEPVSARSRRERREAPASEPDDEEMVTTRNRRRRRAAPAARPEKEPVSARSRPHEVDEGSPEPGESGSREPTGPEPASFQDGPTTGSTPRIDLDELEGQSTLDDAPFVVDTVAWTKPHAAARAKGGSGARPRATARAAGPPKASARAARPTEAEDDEQRRRRAREGTARPRTTAAQVPVAPAPRWVLPLGLLILAILAYGVWMVWTA